MNIGENIRKYRLQKDKKQLEIYEAIGINQPTYSKIENNKYKINIETLVDIATVLEVDITELMGLNKIEKNHIINSNCSSGNNHSVDLIVSLKEQINLLKEQNQINKEIINNLKEEITSLKGQLKKS